MNARLRDYVGMYRELREEGVPRLRSWLLACGWWVYFPRLFPEVDMSSSQPEPSEPLEHGFIADVYEPWLAYEGTEWGDQLRALHDAYGMGEDYAGLSDAELRDVESILRRCLEEAHEDGWLHGGDGDRDYYAGMSDKAKAAYPEILNNWEKQNAWSEVRMASLERSKVIIPDWMKP